MSQTKPLVLLFSLFLLVGLSGCELVATAYVQKEWVTDPRILLDANRPDLTTRVEVKATKLIGRDAKLQELKELKELKKIK